MRHYAVPRVLENPAVSSVGAVYALHPYIRIPLVLGANPDPQTCRKNLTLGLSQSLHTGAEL
jgi:hypothetical protein